MYFVLTDTGGVQRHASFLARDKAKEAFRECVRALYRNDSQMAHEVSRARLEDEPRDYVALIQMVEVIADSETAALAALRAGDYLVLWQLQKRQ